MSRLLIVSRDARSARCPLSYRTGTQPLRVRAGSLLCCWAVRELGLSGTSVGKLPGIGQSAVSRAVTRVEKISDDMNLSLTK
jgi:hypothetical protein